MKCVLNKCPSIFESDGRKWCSALSCYIWDDSECELPNKIREIRNELIRKGELLETILGIDNNKTDETV